MGNMTRHEEYREQDACANCTFCEIISDYDDPSQYYCNHDRTKRPISGSLSMSEGYNWPLDLDEEPKEYTDWEAWREGRMVEPYGICPQYIRSSQ